MEDDFLQAYETELEMLYERGAAFAKKHEDHARGLGILTREHFDPGIKGLFEGAAFLAARVQLKIDDEFSTFTNEFLNSIFPDALAPIPSLATVKVQPDLGDKDAAQGKEILAQSSLVAVAKNNQGEAKCAYRTASKVKVWPIALEAARYFGRPAGLSSVGCDPDPSAEAGLVLSVSANFPDLNENSFSALALDELNIQFAGSSTTMGRLYEQVHAHLVGFGLVYERASGDRKYVRLPKEIVQEPSFEADDYCLPHNKRSFNGFALLREYFAFPQRFFGLRLSGLEKYLKSVEGRTIHLVFETSRSQPTLEAEVKADSFALNTINVVNLYDADGLSVTVRDKYHDIALPDLPHREIYSVKKVRAQRKNRKIVDCVGLYTSSGKRLQEDLLPRFSIKQLPRLFEDQDRFEHQATYVGNESVLTLHDPTENAPENAIRSLRVDCLCSSRYLPEILFESDQRAEFQLENDQKTPVTIVHGPTVPRENLILRRRRTTKDSGAALWRLISFLSVSKHGLDFGESDDTARGLREILELFSDISERATQNDIQELKSISTEPSQHTIVRNGVAFPALGTKITLRFSKASLFNSGLFLFVSVLERFLAEFAAANTFTRTKVVTDDGLLDFSFPPRTGTGPLV